MTAPVLALQIAVPIVDMVLLWQERARQRSELLNLDARMRRDIGVTEIEIWREANKPFWKA